MIFLDGVGQVSDARRITNIQFWVLDQRFFARRLDTKVEPISSRCI